MTISCWFSDFLVFPLVFPLVFSLVFFVFFAGFAPFVKDRPIRVLPYIILVFRATLITISEPPCCVSSLVFVHFVPNSKIPHKNSPNFFCDLLVC